MSDARFVRPALAPEVAPEIIWAFAFDAEGRATPLDGPPDLRVETGFVWMHLDLIHANTAVG